MTNLCSSADLPPQAEIHNEVIRARVYLPDPQKGFYRGTRFDWSGVIANLEFGGHNYYPHWFQRADPKVRDFIYAGNDIVAGPCTAITGPVEEFIGQGKALGFDEAKPGGTFIKIGVGVLRKPDDRNYEIFRVYDLVDGGKWTVQPEPNSVAFRQEVSDPASGYAYDYRKTVSLSQGQPRLVLDHALRNTGQRPIQTSVYNHNFLYLDQLPPSPEVSITLPFAIERLGPPEKSLAQIQGNQIQFTKRFTGEDRVYLEFAGFGSSSSDYDIRIENRKAGAGVRITADRPLAKAALWAIRAPLSVEPFIEMNIAPGAEFTWRIQYDHYLLPKSGESTRR